MITGAIHVHSTYSDGELTLEELKALYRSAGCSFVCLTDHAEAFDEKKLSAYRAQLESLSDGLFRFIPGLEYECEQRMHILGIGASRRLDTLNPQEVIRAIQDMGACSVIAHPKNSMFSWIEGFRVLPDGIEVWNTKYDGRYAPRPSTFNLLNRLQERKPSMRALYGQDLHWRRQFRGLLVCLETGTLDSDDILGAIARGAFFGIKRKERFPSSGRLSAEVLARFGRIHDCSEFFFGAARGLSDFCKARGLQPPPVLKALLRRLF